jgi:hypothetical protein
VDTAKEACIAVKAAELTKMHCKEFMKRAFPTRENSNAIPQSNASAKITLCRPQSDIDYIINCLKNWKMGVSTKTMECGPERDSIAKF